jgi:hypothetical protein
MNKNNENDTSWDDPIVAEVRTARDAFAKRFNYDIAAIFDHLKLLEDEGRKQGRVYVDRPPKLLEQKRTGTRS